MAKPNYAFAKRQRDLAKKQKKEEKKLRKTTSTTEGGETSADAGDNNGPEDAEQAVERTEGQPLTAEQVGPLSGSPVSAGRPSRQV